MLDDKFHWVFQVLFELLEFLRNTIDGFHVSLVIGVGQFELVVKAGDDSERALLDEFENVGVVDVLDFVERDVFFDVESFLAFEHVFDEVLLELFVGVVNAELFEGVSGEDFEPVDVEDSDEFSLVDLGLGGVDDWVDGFDDLLEHSEIDQPCESVSGLVCFFELVVGLDGLRADFRRFEGEKVLELCFVDFEKVWDFGRSFDGIVV